VPKNLPAYGALNGQTVVVGTGEALLGPGRAAREACPPITGEPGKWRGGREGIGGGRSTDDGEDNTTSPEGRAPTSSTQA